LRRARGSDPDAFGIELPAPRTIEDLARDHGGEVDAAARARRVSRVVSPEHARFAEDLVVATSPKRLDAARRAPGVLLAAFPVARRCPEGNRWIHPHASWVVARLLEPLAVAAEAPRGIHERALVDAGADVDASATVHAGAVVRAGARVGPRSVVGEGAVIYGGVRIGSGVVIGPLAVVGRPGFGFAVGPRGETVRVPQLGGVLVEDDVEIGALATIDAGTLGPTVLRAGAKLDAHVHVAHNVEIGAGTFVAAQAGFAGSTRVGEAVLVGGQAGVTDHAVIGARARIAAKSGVIGDVAGGTTVAGYPAVPRIRWLRAWARLFRNEERRRK
jgi:UDP-3-O-[3-hydroxymyristoyl] glucosamine N-acyltransferase